MLVLKSFNINIFYFFKNLSVGVREGAMKKNDKSEFRQSLENEKFKMFFTGF